MNAYLEKKLTEMSMKELEDVKEFINELQSSQAEIDEDYLIASVVGKLYSEDGVSISDETVKYVIELMEENGSFFLKPSVGYNRDNIEDVYLNCIVNGITDLRRTDAIINDPVIQEFVKSRGTNQRSLKELNKKYFGDAGLTLEDLYKES